MQRDVDTLTRTIRKYLERKSLDRDHPPWKMGKSELGGFGVFAARDIEAGELIFEDRPLILGPRAAPACPLVCVSCYKKDNLRLCAKKCGLQVCSGKCEESANHRKECKIIRQWQTTPITEESAEKLMKVLSPVRSLLLSDEDKDVVRCLKAHITNQHGFEVDVMKNVLRLNIKEDEEYFMRFVCSVMDANAFEVLIGNEDNQSSVRGLYPLGSLANHSCLPNTIHVFNNRQHMIVRASIFIPEGAEIFHSYSRCTWGTPTRRYHLYRTKHFRCKCPRCTDPTEFGSYVSAILCKVCTKGKVVPIDSSDQSVTWQCEDCGRSIDNADVAALSSLLGSTLNCFSDAEDTEILLRLIEKKLPSLVSENHETVIELKYKVIWILGYRPGHTWSELSDDLLSIKQRYCEDLLHLLEVLRLGQCKIRGLLLFELYCCRNELERRGIKSGNVSKDCHQMNLLAEAADILLYDVTAPPEIKKLWPSELTEEIRSAVFASGIQKIDPDLKIYSQNNYSRVRRTNFQDIALHV